MTTAFRSNRRDLLRRAGALAALSIAGAAARASQGFAAARPKFVSYPFSLGVASGDPVGDGFVIWTRLAPDPFDPMSVSSDIVPVIWEVASDARMRNIVQRGQKLATRDLAHTVHAEVRGLPPGRPYWYRFRITGSDASPIGQAWTAPELGAALDRFRFAVASCQHFEQGYFGAYRHMAAEDVDLIVFLGDYIYESSWGRNHVRKHSGPEPTTLIGYRNRHAQYKTDEDLQRMHALVPWLVTWDDHEVDNDYAADQGEYLEADFIKRRAAAYQAYYEHMPLERSMLPRGPDMRIYERFGYGRLALFHVLDDRQYRHIQVCPRPQRGGGSNTLDDAACPERHDPNRSLLGFAQEKWLHAGLDGSPARWNVLAQQTLMAQLDQTPGPGASHWTDAWDGYPDARRRLMDFLAERRPSNPVVIGGDVHSHWVCDLKQDFNRADSPTVATEFCGTSITSQAWAQSRNLALLPDNPHVRFVESEKRGYVVMELSGKQCRATLRGLDNEKVQATGISTQASFVVENGRPGAQRG